MKSQIFKVLFILLILPFTSCEELILETTPSCSGSAIKVENRSHTTVQKIIINDINYGTIDPDEVREIQFSSGTYTVELRGVSGGTGCSEGTIILDDCETRGYSCRH